jgi:hypothetical protein
VLLDSILNISSGVMVDSLVSVSMVVDDSEDFKDSWLSVFEVSNISSKPDSNFVSLAFEYCIDEIIIATMVNRKRNTITFFTILSVVFI